MEPVVRHYCTYFDKHYLFKGLALYRSLERHAPPFMLHVLCFDEETVGTLSALNLAHVELITEAEFEAGDDALTAAKAARSRVEYYWTCTPSLPLFLFARHPEVNQLTYLDADLLFFSSPTPVFEEFGNDSILIIEHRYPKWLKHLEARGVYNVQMMSFRRDADAAECLHWWREQCLEWCCDRLENGRFGDQKYLDDWPSRFGGVHVLRHLGAGVAPWNFSQWGIDSRDGGLYVGGQPLIFYHFHQFRALANGDFYWASSIFEEEKPLPAAIYREYVAAIKGAMAEVLKVEPGFAFGIESPVRVALRAGARKYVPLCVRNVMKRVVR